MAVFYNKDKTELVVTCKCSCGDAAHIVVEKEDSDDYCIISYMNGNFYKDQCGTFATFKKKCKKIFAIIRNKDYYYSEVIMTKDEFETFREYINRV